MRKNNQKALAFVMAFAMVVNTYAMAKIENKTYAILPEKPNLLEKGPEEESKKLKLKK